MPEGCSPEPPEPHLRIRPCSVPLNQSSLLCGSCQPGLSASLGSPLCLQWPNNWPTLHAGITIAAILAGITLVAILLILNMIVAVGSLNGLTFQYANIVHANQSILLPFLESSLVTIWNGHLHQNLAGVGFSHICFLVL